MKAELYVVLQKGPSQEQTKQLLHHEDMPLSVTAALTEDVTVVTAYINIGTIKGAGKHGRYSYSKWAKEFGRIKNPVYAFFADDQDVQYFKNMRKSKLNRTRVIKININETWTFSVFSIIRKLFVKRRYNPLGATAKANYSSVVNAKFEFVARALEENHFKTKYFSWMDYGYLRYPEFIGTSNSSLEVHLPPYFNKSHIAFSTTQPENVRISGNHPRSARDIVSHAGWLVNSGFFIGTLDMMKKLTIRYKATLKDMIKLGWVGNDEDTLYYMVQPKNNITHDVEFQVYYGKGTWIHMGLLCLGKVRANESNIAKVLKAKPAVASPQHMESSTNIKHHKVV